MDKKPENKAPEQNTEKYFNEEEYITAVVQPDGTVKPATKKQHELEELINLLSSGDREHKDAALDLLKNEGSITTLLEAIAQTENKTHKAALIAACWESGLDIKGHESFFAALAIDTDIFISLEAITVLDSADFSEAPVRQEIIALLNKATTHPNEAMLSDLKERLAE
jgi:acetolactate synthase small subunit